MGRRSIDHEQVCEMHEAGLSVEEIASALQCTYRQISRILWKKSAELPPITHHLDRCPNCHLIQPCGGCPTVTEFMSGGGSVMPASGYTPHWREISAAADRIHEEKRAKS